MKGFKIIEGTAEYIEACACEEDTQAYSLESLQFTHRAFLYEAQGVVSKHKECMYVALFRLRKRRL